MCVCAMSHAHLSSLSLYVSVAGMASAPLSLHNIYETGGQMGWEGGTWRQVEVGGGTWKREENHLYQKKMPVALCLLPIYACILLPSSHGIPGIPNSLSRAFLSEDAL